jgi:hypothetical protein
MQALAAIDLRAAIYVTCPVSSGRRELDLMLRLSQFDRDRLRREHPALWRREVLEPNRAAARAAVAMTRDRFAGRIVIDPSLFEIEGLEQPDYDSLCAEIIQHHVGHLVLADGWPYSRGARVEVALALRLALDIQDVAGRPIRPEQIVRLLDEARASLIRAGFPPERAGELLPQAAWDSTAHDGVHGLQFLQQ